MFTNAKDYEGAGATTTETTTEYGFVSEYDGGKVLSIGGWDADKAFMKDLVASRNAAPFGDETYRLVSKTTTKSVTVKVEE
jgi:hypothetical protein